MRMIARGGGGNKGVGREKKRVEKERETIVREAGNKKSKKSIERVGKSTEG